MRINDALLKSILAKMDDIDRAGLKPAAKAEPGKPAEDAAPAEDDEDDDLRELMAARESGGR